MPHFEAILWLPFTLGLTGAGLVLSWLAWRRRGAAAGIKGLSLSLLPLAAYLTGLLQLVWRVAAASVHWVAHLVFSPLVWVGLALLGLSVVLYGVSNRLSARRDTSATGTAVPGRSATHKRRLRRQPCELSSSRPAAESADDFAEIEQILRNRGIT